MEPASRPRFVVVYQDRRLPLPDGEFVVGRGLGCHIRFNAAEVSRQHLRLVARRGRLFAENLSTTTGTLLNGRRMTQEASLSHGDVLVLGPRRLRIEVEDVAGELAVAADEGGDTADEATRPGALGAELLEVPSPPQSIDFHTCPSCRTKVDFEESRCGNCGHEWSAESPSSFTGRDTLRGMEPPEMTALRGGVPVVYASDELTIDTVLTDLEPHRAFVPSPLLDPTRTRCELTLLPDGVHAMSLTGVVRSVRATASAQGPAGMEVHFTDVPASVRAWLDRWKQARAR